MKQDGIQALIKNAATVLRKWLLGCLRWWKFRLRMLIQSMVRLYKELDGIPAMAKKEAKNEFPLVNEKLTKAVLPQEATSEFRKDYTTMLEAQKNKKGNP